MLHGKECLPRLFIAPFLIRLWLVFSQKVMFLTLICNLPEASKAQQMHRKQRPTRIVHFSLRLLVAFAACVNFYKWDRHGEIVSQVVRHMAYLESTDTLREP